MRTQIQPDRHTVCTFFIVHIVYAAAAAECYSYRLWQSQRNARRLWLYLITARVSKFMSQELLIKDGMQSLIKTDNLRRSLLPDFHHFHVLLCVDSVAFFWDLLYNSKFHTPVFFNLPDKACNLSTMSKMKACRIKVKKKKVGVGKKRTGVKRSGWIL